jgi:predicted DNA-binding transcriptional regulator YafY
VVKGPGRDQREPMERLVRIAAVLGVAGKAGVPRERLLRIAGFEGTAAADQLSRELRHLTRQGWQIENIAAPGEDAVYRMTTVDNRLRVRLTPQQQTALRRAVLLADRADLVKRLGLPEASRPAEVEARVPAAGAAEPAALTSVVRAVRDRCLLHFGYKGTPRVVHPESLRSQNGTWYLRGVEDADLAGGRVDETTVKSFVVGRMSDPEIGEPGSAAVVPSVRHTGLHPMTWEIDDPVEVTLRTTADYEDDVRRWLGEPASVTPEAGAPAGRVLMRYRVTNRAALRTRLNELGRRVQLVGPDEVRQEVVAALAAAAGHTKGTPE